MLFPALVLLSISLTNFSTARPHQDPEDLPAVDIELVAKVHKAKAAWTATADGPFSFKTFREAKRMCGTILGTTDGADVTEEHHFRHMAKKAERLLAHQNSTEAGHHHLHANKTTTAAPATDAVEGRQHRHRKSTTARPTGPTGPTTTRPSTASTASTASTSTGTIPASFDARIQWPNYIHPIIDQGDCGSCWAYAASESLSDRLAIQSNGAINVVLSPQNLISCDKLPSSYGCNGGSMENAWRYMEQYGLVAAICYPDTSHLHGSTGSCSVNDMAGAECPSGVGSTKYYYASSEYAVPGGIAGMQREIMTHGPIEVAFTVYGDFYSYSSGVYHHVTGSVAGGHAVKMLGWGTSNGVDYWICANSWGTSWGMGGFFLIRRGNNECGIESEPVAGMADTTHA